MAEDLRNRLEALSKLRGGDREAVLRRLAPEERRLLDALRHPVSQPVEKPAVAKVPVKRLPPPPCSPWLAKRIAQVLDGRDTSSTTTRARDALRIVVAQERQP